MTAVRRTADRWALGWTSRSPRATPKLARRLLPLAAGLVLVSTLSACDLTGIKQIEAGAGHSCALNDAGTVKCWGKNSTASASSAMDRSLTPRLRARWQD